VKNGASLKVLENDANVETWITEEQSDPTVLKINKMFPTTHKTLNSIF
jgi:hypothetical protein